MNPLWKIISFGVSSGVGFAAQKSVEVIWEKVLHKPRVKGDDTDAELPILQLATFAAVTAGVNAVVGAWINRKLRENYGE